MKVKELARQIKRIQQHVEKEKIIEKAQEIVEKHGVIKKEELSYRVNYDGKFSGKDYSGKDFRIEHSSGWSDFGGEGLRIDYDNETVFSANTYEIEPTFDSRKNDQYTREWKDIPRIQIGDLYVHRYSPGNWEKQLSLIYRKGPKIDTKSIPKVVEPEVEQSKLEELARRFPIKI